MFQPCSSLAAELMAIREGLRQGLRQGWRRLLIESNCSSAISLVNRSEFFCNEMKGLIREIKLLQRELGCCEVRFIGREANSLAHGLAKITASRVVDAGYLGDLPVELLSTPTLVYFLLCPSLGTFTLKKN